MRVRLERYTDKTDYAKTFKLTPELEVKSKQLSNEERLCLAFSITPDTEMNLECQVFPFRFRNTGIRQRGVATDCVHNFRSLSAVNVIADHFDKANQNAFGSKVMVQELAAIYRLIQLVGQNGSLPEALTPIALSPQFKQMVTNALVLVHASHTPIASHPQKLLGRLYCACVDVWQSCIEIKGPLAADAARMAAVAKGFVRDIFVHSIIEYQIVPGEPGTKSAAEVSARVRDAMAIAPVKFNMLVMLHQVYTDVTIRDLPMQRAFSTNTPPQAHGARLTLRLADGTVERCVGKLMSL